MDFLKLEALGNDYVYASANQVDDCNLSNLARMISQRRFGIGSDGLILVEKLTDSTIRMTMINADGSEGAMCGNGIRGAVLFAIKKLGIQRSKIKVKTKSRDVFVTINDTLINKDIKRLNATVDMGVVKDGKNPSVIAEELSKVGLYVDKRQVFHVNTGNHHLVFFEPNYSLAAICSAVIRSGLFPDGVNVERVFKIKNDSQNKSLLYAEVHERGSGKTLSCGSGSVAMAYAFSVYSYRPLDVNLNVDVITEGGTLSVYFDGGRAFLTGDVNEVFEGRFDHMGEKNEL